jgi:NAD(P)-dependent dehydrogenase (short-subunit alcohol dehydrogenase family)
MQALPEKCVVITGASTGIGRRCALDLASRRYRVFAGVRKASDGDRLRQDSSDSVIPVLLDVTDPRSVALAAAHVAASCPDGALHGLVNNAGVAIAGPMEFLPVEELRRSLEINVVGVATVTQHFLPLLRKGAGRVVNISSTAGFLAVPMIGAYAASKSALEGMSDALRQELRPWGLHVSLIEPGNIRTPIWDKSEIQADTLSRNLPAEAHRLYGGQMAAARRLAHKARDGASPPEVVARAVEHALSARHPRTRYRVGTSSRLEGFLAYWLPDRLRDRIVEAAFR